MLQKYVVNAITGDLDLVTNFNGTASQYVRGDGQLANFPTISGGGASVSYYLNGSVSQGTFGGVAMKQINKIPIIGTGTDFTINANGYIQSFITDANDPSQLEIPAGNWNFETYFSASSNGGSPSFYVELYKWDGATLSLIASNSTNPEGITNGTAIDLYITALAVPQTTLALTDRLAVRIYVTHSSRTIKLHTEDNHLSQIITTFSTGLTALNGLTAQVQNLAVGTSGTDFAISSLTSIHTFNLPTASATNRGALSSTDWSTFNGKQDTISLTTTGTSGPATLVGSTLNVPNYATSSSGVFGLTNSSGVYTFYSTLILAMAAASSGQTIEMFADYTETSGAVTLKNGVSINGNSHTYTLNKTGTDSALIDNGVAVDCSINNIKIVRTGGTASTASNACILLSGASNIKTDAIFSSVVGVAIILNNANCYLNGGKSFTTGYHSIYVLAGNLLNHYNELNVADYYYGINNSGTIINCHVVSKGSITNSIVLSSGTAVNCSATALTANASTTFSNSGVALNCSGKNISGVGFGNSGKAENCSGYSTSSTGFSGSSSSININCSGYSISGVGLGGYNGQFFGCIGYSTGNYGMSVSNGGDGQNHIVNCSGISTAASAGYFAYTPNNGGIKNCTFKSLYNSSAGHGVELPYNNSVNGCNIYVTGTGANCLYKSTAGTIKYALNIFEGATTPVNANITQGVINVLDIQGNILM